MTMDLTDPTLIDGRYRLDVELGKGAFGAVYKATQVVMGRDMRQVALKLFHGKDITPENLDEMMKDALEILALIADLTDWEIRQHFVTVYDLGVTREKTPRGYVAMELVGGGSLEGRIRSFKKFTLRGTLHYLAQIARAMAFMHSKRFVHSDLKPANVLVFRGREHDLVKIGDFGLAGKYLGPFANGPSGGTISYMALEVLCGMVTTPAADVFSIGLIAYEMLTGGNPYNEVGATLDRNSPTYDADYKEMQIHAREKSLRLDTSAFPDLAAMRTDSNDTPDARLPMLLDVVNQMLATDVSRRYASAEAVQEDLQRIVAGRPPSLTPGGIPVETEADDPLGALRDDFQYYLQKEDWSKANQIAGKLRRAGPKQAEGYRLKAEVSLRQAKRLGPDAANSRLEQAIKDLGKGLAACNTPADRRCLQEAMANVYQALGDDAAAEQWRRMGS